MNEKQKELLMNMRQARQEKKKERAKRREERDRENDQYLKEYKASKAELKEQVKKLRQEIKEIKRKSSQEIKQCKQQINDKTNKKARVNELKEERAESIILIKENIFELKFNHGKQFNTLSWRLFKWTHGLRKEFTRIKWSSPSNTFKYLLIIIVLVLILSGLFMIVNQFVDLINF